MSRHPERSEGSLYLLLPLLLPLSLQVFRRHPEPSEGPPYLLLLAFAVAVALALLAVIPSAARNLLLYPSAHFHPRTGVTQHLSFPHHPARLLPLALLLASLTAQAQTAPTPPAQQPPPTPQGQVLFESHGAPPPTPDDDATPEPQAVPPGQTPTGPVLTDEQRSAVLFTAYDLDARIAPATGHLTMRARVTLRNITSQPLSRVALQISSSLRWESATLIGPSSSTPLTVTQHLIDTDADHTGKSTEAVLDLPAPLAPGATLTLDTLYSGNLSADTSRLERLGASATQALTTDWDAIGYISSSSSSSSSSADNQPTSTLSVALRGFGNVLWYPTASPQLFLGDGAKLFQAIGQQRLAQRATTIHLRLAVEYRGAPPVAAYFCGRRQPLVAHPDDPAVPPATATGIATADFAAQPLGFRQPSLFVVQQPETAAAPLPEVFSSSLPSQPGRPSDSETPTEPVTSSSSSSTEPGAATEPGAPSSPMATSSAKVGDALGPAMLSVATTDTASIPTLAASAERIAPILQTWYGPKPLGPLTILDNPGDPFEDNALLVAPVTKLASNSSTAALAHSLTHAWVDIGQPWFDEGLAQFTSLLWVEQDQGRPAAILELNNLMQPLNIAEVGFDTEQEANAASAPTGEPLISATDEIYYRRKAAAVWWMLRGIAGDKPLQQALTEFRDEPATSTDPTVQAVAFEKLLEKTSGKDLAWFFSDWIFRDRGLPDLAIVDVQPRLMAAGKGHDAGWLVSVTVRNDGAPAVDVPLNVLSGAFTTNTRIHIAGFSNATTRVIVNSPPTEVILNDGSTPEVRTATHTREVVLQPTTPAP